MRHFSVYKIRTTTTKKETSRRTLGSLYILCLKDIITLSYLLLSLNPVHICLSTKQSWMHGKRIIEVLNNAMLKDVEKLCSWGIRTSTFASSFPTHFEVRILP